MAATTVARLGALFELDLAPYRKNLAQAKTEGDAASKSIGGSFKDALKGAFGSSGGNENVRAFVTDLKAGRVSLRDIGDQVSIAGTAVKNAFKPALLQGFHTGLNGIKSVLGGLKGALGSVFQGFAIGAGIGGFQALGRAISDVIGFIPNLIDKGRDYGNLVDQISDATGATALASSELAGTLQFLGAPIGSIVNLLGQMSRNLEQNAGALKAAGVEVEDANGGLLNQVQILENARRAFQSYGDGTQKASIISREFGRGGLQVLVDYLKLTDAQAQKITDDLQAQGLIISESQRNMAETAQREGNRFQNALTGLGVTLFNIVGPQITAFFSNLSDTITSHAKEIADAISNVVSFILGLASSLTGISGSMDSFSGGIQAASGVTSPYSAKLLQLNVELADLTSKTKTATDSTDDQRKAIGKQIDAVNAQIAILDKLERQQDRTYKKALDGINAVLDAQASLLDAEDRAAQRAQQDLDLTERLRQARISLFEAQAQLRADALAGKSTDQDTLDIADMSKAVLDAQKAISEQARSRATDDRRAEIDATKAYIASVAKILEEADSKQAALNTLRRREAVLTARKETQIAAGDTTGAGDTGLKIEALKTAETRAQEEIRNGVRKTALETQKSLLENERAAIKSLTADANAEAVKRTKAEIAELTKQDAAWKLHMGQTAGYTAAANAALQGKGGLSEAFEAARLSGMKFGADVKKALGGIGDVLRTLGDALGAIAGAFDKIRIAIDFLTNPETQKKIQKALPGPLGYIPQSIGPAVGSQPIAQAIGGLQTVLGLLNTLFLDKNAPPFPTRADGGYVNDGLYRLHAREYVIDRSLTARLERALTLPQMPTLAAASTGWSGGQPAIIRVEIGGNKLFDYIDQGLAYRRRR